MVVVTARSYRYRSRDVLVKLGCQTVSNEPVSPFEKFNSESPLIHPSVRVDRKSHFWVRGWNGRNPPFELRHFSWLPHRITICAVYLFSFNAFYLSSRFELSVLLAVINSLRKLPIIILERNIDSDKIVIIDHRHKNNSRSRVYTVYAGYL